MRSTRRPGADAEIGGFGGVFDLKAAGYTDPLLVSGTDGVGTKLRIAVDAGIHDTVGTQLHRTVFFLTSDLVYIYIYNKRTLSVWMSGFSLRQASI